MSELLDGLERARCSRWYCRASVPAARGPVAGPVLAATDARSARIGKALSSTYYEKHGTAFLASDEGQTTVERQVLERYNDCLRWIVPWVQRHINLSTVDLVEIGSGTGSSACAFALACKSVVGCDIDRKSVDAARARAEILKVKNASFSCESAETLLARLGDGNVGAILLYAALEHMTFAERTNILRQCWTALRPGGHLIVGDTPNRLTYGDGHTSLLPFFDMLPEEVAIEYASRSPRREFVDAMAETGAHWFGSKEMTLTRWGRGISYHDFELALGPIWDCVVGDGFDPEIIDVKPLVLEEVLLAIWMEREAKHIPPAFYRRSIDVILRKPG